jgi:hypothetical protein
LHSRAIDIDNDCRIADIIDADAHAFDPLDLHQLLSWAYFTESMSAIASAPLVR